MKQATSDQLERGRAAADGARPNEAYELLSAVDASSPLGGRDLERVAMAARLTGRHEEMLTYLERAHEDYLAAGEIPGAVRTAIWLTIELSERGEFARGGGWFAVARRLLDGYGEDCVERGYLCVPAGLQHLGAGDLEHAREMFEQAAAIGERFGEEDLVTLGRLGSGQTLVRLGEIERGTALFDEAMVAVTAGRVSPVVAGIVYCAVIETCQTIFDLRRAQEWTTALTSWCDAHPEIVAFRGQCLTYRAEIMRLHGAWPEAMDEATRAREVLSRPSPHPAVGATVYQQAELHRLRGEFSLAEAAYREASRWGRHPEPGLALLRLAQGRTAAAEASIRRTLDETQDPATRSRLLPAFVEIVLAGDLEAARSAAEELASLAKQFDAALLRAVAAQAEGQVQLAAGNAQSAAVTLRRAWSEWQALEAPYETARVRALIARACEQLGDGDSAEMERDAAAWTFRQLGALADLAALEGETGAPTPGGLTPREVEVLRLIAQGKSNRDIARDLVISEKTVARHVSNILAKADVPSRTAAAAYAHRHGLL